MQIATVLLLFLPLAFQSEKTSLISEDHPHYPIYRGEIPLADYLRTAQQAVLQDLRQAIARHKKNPQPGLILSEQSIKVAGGKRPELVLVNAYLRTLLMILAEDVETFQILRMWGIPQPELQKILEKMKAVPKNEFIESWERTHKGKESARFSMKSYADMNIEWCAAILEDLPPYSINLILSYCLTRMSSSFTGYLPEYQQALQPLDAENSRVKEVQSHE